MLLVKKYLLHEHEDNAFFQTFSVSSLDAAWHVCKHKIRVAEKKNISLEIFMIW